MSVTIITVGVDHAGWAGWQGGKICDYTPKDAPMEDVLAALAAKAMEMGKTLSIICNTHQNHRLIGWSYSPQGYSNTPDGPRLDLFVIEGDVLNPRTMSQSPFLRQNELETLISCLRKGIDPKKAVYMTHEALLDWHINHGHTIDSNLKGW